MIDIRLVREDTDRVRDAVRRKKFVCDVDAILELDARRRLLIARAEALRADQKSANAGMVDLEKGSPEFLAKVAEMRAFSSQVKDAQGRLQAIEMEWQEAIITIPNLPHDSVPEGESAEDNVVVRTWGPSSEAFPDALPHYEIPCFGEWVDLAAGSKVTGAGFPFYRGEMATLVRALIQYFVDEAVEAGYSEVIPPLLVNPTSATATGQLPDKEGQMYHIPNEDLYLIPTAEVPLTNLYRDRILESELLPLNHCGYTPCFRREAGSYGKDVRGLNRVHQFDKVELVKWVRPEASFEELNALVAHVERLLRHLELPYRLLLMCAGEIGFPHAKQYDLEVWAAGQRRWLEVSSCSDFTDFQARRAGIRFRDEDGKPKPLHTLNGSALAIPRTLGAILENNLQKDGRVRIPKVLQSRLGRCTIG